MAVEFDLLEPLWWLSSSSWRYFFISEADGVLTIKLVHYVLVLRVHRWRQVVGFLVATAASFHLCNVLQLCMIPTSRTPTDLHRSKSIVFVKKW
uniref:Uncharacterized protein n=1 Tax=Aegilops tauschii TaxID=37682 RepID=M8BDQ5_AEGTA